MFADAFIISKMEATKSKPVREKAQKKQKQWWKEVRKQLMKGPQDTFSATSTSAGEQTVRAPSDGGGLSDVLGAYSGDNLNLSTSLSSADDSEVGVKIGHINTSSSSDISFVRRKHQRTNVICSDEEHEGGPQICSTPVRGQDCDTRRYGGKENAGDLHLIRCHIHTLRCI